MMKEWQKAQLAAFMSKVREEEPTARLVGYRNGRCEVCVFDGAHMCGSLSGVQPSAWSAWHEAFITLDDRRNP